MKHIIVYTTFLAAILLLAGCQNSKYFTKMAVKQENAGLMHEAADNYYMALLKKRNNVDAQIGLKKNGQLVLNEKLNDFAKQRNFGTHKDAVYSFLEARDYKEKISSVGVSLQLADFYESDYNAAKDAYMLELYEDGTSLLEDQKFTEAEAKFQEICKFDSNFKDAKELGNIAYLQPIYATGVGAMEMKHYREAYNNFEKVLSRTTNYKDSRMRMDQCLASGMYTIALLSFENASGTPGLDAKVSAYTLDALTDIHDPFLRVVDRENMEAILQEQKLQLSGVIDQNTAVTVGELVGAQALLTGTVLGYSEKKGTLRSKQRDGYMAYQEKVLNKEDGKYYYQTRYKPTSYTEYYNSNSCTVSFQYKLINLKTGEIIKTEIIEKDMSDEVLYGKFDGDVNNLFPAGQGTPNLAVQDKRALQGLMQGRQELKSSSDITHTLFTSISSQMSSTISHVVKDIVK